MKSFKGYQYDENTGWCGASVNAEPITVSVVGALDKDQQLQAYEAPNLEVVHASGFFFHLDESGDPSVDAEGNYIVHLPYTPPPGPTNEQLYDAMRIIAEKLGVTLPLDQA
jgi:hypothetical protein